MAVNRTPGKTPSRRLAFINAGLYLGCVALGGFLVAPAAREILIWWREPVSYLPFFQRSATLAFLEALLALVGAMAVGRALAGQRPLRWLSVSVYGLVSLLIVYWSVGLPSPTHASALHPRGVMVQHLKTLSKALEAHERSEGRFPEAAEAALKEALGDSPWFSFGHRLPLRVVSERGLGARLAGREGDLAGTLYYVASPTRDDYWLTAVVLDGAPTGHLDFIRDPKGHPMIFSSRSSSVKDENKPLLTPGD